MEICFYCAVGLDLNENHYTQEGDAYCCADCASGWTDLDSQTQDDLYAWYNVREEDVDADDRRRLATLSQEGRFSAYDCGHCGTRVRQGQPADWDQFQGVCQDEGYGQLCAQCYGLYERLKDYAGD